MDLRLICAYAMLCVMTACAQGQSNDIVADGEIPVRVADLYSFTEGPAADAKGDVYFTDQPNNRQSALVFRYERALQDTDNRLWRQVAERP